MQEKKKTWKSSSVTNSATWSILRHFNLKREYTALREKGCLKIVQISRSKVFENSLIKEV